MMDVVTGVLVAAGVLGLLAVYGWHSMRRSTREKAAVLAQLAGQYEVTLHVQGYSRVVPHTGVVLRMEHGMVVVSERYDPRGDPATSFVERSFPLAAIREIQQVDSRWGPW
jgi:hypothetical protein